MILLHSMLAEIKDEYAVSFELKKNAKLKVQDIDLDQYASVYKEMINTSHIHLVNWEICLTCDNGLALKMLESYFQTVFFFLLCSTWMSSDFVTV